MTAEIIPFHRAAEPLFDWPPVTKPQPDMVIPMTHPKPEIVFEIRDGLFTRLARALMPRRAPRRLAELPRFERVVARNILATSDFRTLSGRD